MDLGIKGRQALVCGASRGLGKACAFALAREGVNLTIVARTRDALAEHIARLDDQSVASIHLDEVHGKQPGLPDGLPFLPQDLGVYLASCCLSTAATVGQGQQRLEVVADADVVSGHSSRSRGQRQ